MCNLKMFALGVFFKIYQINLQKHLPIKESYFHWLIAYLYGILWYIEKINLLLTKNKCKIFLGTGKYAQEQKVGIWTFILVAFLKSAIYSTIYFLTYKKSIIRSFIPRLIFKIGPQSSLKYIFHNIFSLLQLIKIWEFQFRINILTFSKFSKYFIIFK